MPGTYDVSDRRAIRGRAGLMLPFPPTTGPIILENGETGLQYTKMGELVIGNVPHHSYPGIWTDGISDCVVLAAVVWEGNGWNEFCWMHLSGGLHSEWLSSAARIKKAASMWAVIASRDRIGTSTMKDYLMSIGIPDHQISVYISRGDFKFGMRFFGGMFGEIKPWP
jgi:hypothetical protein